MSAEIWNLRFYYVSWNLKKTCQLKFEIYGFIMSANLKKTCQLKFEIYGFINSSAVVHMFKFCMKYRSIFQYRTWRLS